MAIKPGYRNTKNISNNMEYLVESDFILARHYFYAQILRTVNS